MSDHSKSAEVGGAEARFRWLKVVIAAGVVGLVGLALWSTLPPRGFLTGLYPLDGERAVVLMRANYSNDPDRFWLGVIRADDELLWSEELPASTYAVYSGHGLTVDAKRIGVHVTDRKTFTQQLGYQFKTGTPSGRRRRQS